MLPAEYDGHELDKYRDGDVGRADVGQKQEDRLGEQLVAVLHGGEDNHVMMIVMMMKRLVMMMIMLQP